MLKKSYFINNAHKACAILLLLPIGLLAQNDSISITKNVYKNQVDIDVYFLGIEESYKRRVAKKMFLGIGLRGLMYRPVINLDLEIEEEFAELVALRPFIDFQLSNNFHIEAGLPFSVAYTEYDSYGVSMGFEAGIFFKVWIFEIGLRPSLLFFKDDKKFNSGKLTNSFLILKTPLGRW